ncbi:MAG TPA: hypothetical protein VHK67_00430 [Rhabdochlamydiaceae bacterium]|jgi:hypothetical protein|nr:hypothetical protein [Rhabdochlamydiaceae bacterium]
MQVSLQSAACTVTCSIVAIYNANESFALWMRCFVISLFVGTCQGFFCRCAAERDNKTGNTSLFGWDKIVKKETAVEFLANSMPGLGTTVINLIALNIIRETLPFPWNWNVGIGTRVLDLRTLFFGFAAGLCGHVVGNLFQLDMLRRSSDPEIQKLLEKVIL